MAASKIDVPTVSVIGRNGDTVILDSVTGYALWVEYMAWRDMATSSDKAYEELKKVVAGLLGNAVSAILADGQPVWAVSDRKRPDVLDKKALEAFLEKHGTSLSAFTLPAQTTRVVSPVKAVRNPLEIPAPRMP